MSNIRSWNNVIVFSKVGEYQSISTEFLVERFSAPPDRSSNYSLACMKAEALADSGIKGGCRYHDSDWNTTHYTMNCLPRYVPKRCAFSLDDERFLKARAAYYLQG
jgi:hypothetical protein